MSDQRSDSTNPSLLDRESKTIHDELGFRLVFYPSGLKGPREEEWTKRDDKPEDYPAGYNVGTFTGHQVQPGRYLGDVDIDWADGVQMIKGILPVTEVGTRRDSRTISHLFYSTSQPQSTKEYSRPGGGNYVEFRGTNVDGTLGHQTFILGKHPNGETVVFHHKGTRFDKLFTGIVIGPADRPSFIDDTDQSGKGGIGPADTFELDYERLLESARRFREGGERTERGWCALHDSNVRPPGS
jgi:hypothetical protein